MVMTVGTQFVKASMAWKRPREDLTSEDHKRRRPESSVSIERIREVIYALQAGSLLVQQLVPSDIELIGRGLCDACWEVRSAAAFITGALVQNSLGREHKCGFPSFSRLIGLLRLGCHDPDPSVNCYFQDIWQSFVGARSGLCCIVPIFDIVISTYIQATIDRNGAIRGAACYCIAEITECLSGRPDHPAEHRSLFTHAHILHMYNALQGATNDASAFVKDAADASLQQFLRMFPIEFGAF